MRTLSRIYGIGLLGATLLAPTAFLPATALAQDHRDEQRKEAANNRRYQDAKHRDEHAWNDLRIALFECGSKRDIANMMALTGSTRETSKPIGIGATITPSDEPILSMLYSHCE